jgi:tripartite-type tricarboxylate transporter receptor subunit TctC
MVAPPKTPAAIAAKLSSAVREFMQQPDVKKLTTDLNVEAMGNSPAEMTSFVKQETERWGKVIRATGIRAE